MSAAWRYVFDRPPELGTTLEVAPGIHWLRMPLPFKLDHINLWLLDDGDGWTAVDTGIAGDEVKAAWERVFATRLAEKPLKRLLVTHFHPDHIGLAGWLAERFGIGLWATVGEWAVGRAISLDCGDQARLDALAFYRAAGFDEALLRAVDGADNGYARRISPIPGRFRRIRAGDVIAIGGRGWRVIVGTGHSPEHACLYCEELGVLISGDHVLPKISPNLSVWPREPEADPVRLYLESLDQFRGLPAETLVLPSHNAPFIGLHGRLDEMRSHHRERLAATVAACAWPATGVEVLRRLFDRELDRHQLFFAIGESLAHLHYLMGEGLVERTRGADGVDRFRRTAAADGGAVGAVSAAPAEA